jgi:perosamine synthetase
VQDATESLGARYHGRPLGDRAHVVCLSFNGNKTVTSGGGGMLVTNEAARAERARYLTTQAKNDPVEYVHDEIGYNYRLTNVQAALGLAQLERLSTHVAAKRRLAAAYAVQLASVPGVEYMSEAPWASSTFWLSTILIDPGVAATDSRAALRALAAEGIQTRPVWQPLHRSRAHAGAMAIGGEHADDIYARALSLPSSVGLTDADQARVIESLTRMLQR